MIYTSYFAKYKGDKGVSITRFNPKWWNGDGYKVLAPSVELLKWWKSLSKEEQLDIENIQKYTQRFIEETLNPLESFVNDIYEALDGKVLLCYEKSSDFCHRHLVADWFIEHGLKCKEL